MEPKEASDRGNRLRSPSFNGLVTFLVLVLVTCASFGLAEFIARRVNSPTSSPPSALAELILDRWAAFRNNPQYHRNGIQINDLGFRRTGIVAIDKAPNTVRIFVLGGSVAYGAPTLYPEVDQQPVVDNSHTIDSYLERKLNSAFPTRHWEVINAAVKGYELRQELAEYLSVLQRYHPDYLLFFDGVNDVFEMLNSQGNYGSYKNAGFEEEFNGLTAPRLMSLKLMWSTWLVNRSSLYRLIWERLSERNRIAARKKRAREAEAKMRAGQAGLTAVEQERIGFAVGLLDRYIHPIRQIDRLTAMEGTQAIFVLQPEISLTRKSLAAKEERQQNYWIKLEGPFYDRGFQTLYPLLSRQLVANSQAEGSRFLDLTAVFDRMKIQTFTDFCHLTPAGNEAVAAAIFDYLVKVVDIGKGSEG
ncbi:MAG TPA: SGNH/GDSL hydrolase family protein [Bryobacteraceae bacterium]|nr:SGNH/GDSL hydrolase family protein [Bryobacteraceae bacterium]